MQNCCEIDRSVEEIIKHEKRRRALGQENLCHWDFAHDN